MPSDTDPITSRKLCVNVAFPVFRAKGRMPIMGMGRHDKERPMPFRKSAQFAVIAVAVTAVVIAGLIGFGVSGLAQQ